MSDTLYLHVWGNCPACQLENWAATYVTAGWVCSLSCGPVVTCVLLLSVASGVLWFCGVRGQLFISNRSVPVLILLSLTVFSFTGSLAVSLHPEDSCLFLTKILATLEVTLLLTRWPWGPQRPAVLSICPPSLKSKMKGLVCVWPAVLGLPLGFHSIHSDKTNTKI